MSLVIAFDTVTESRVAAAAKKSGLEPTDYVKKLVIDHVPPLEDDPLLALFAQWDLEDAHMTSEEVEDENRTWEEFKSNVNAERKRAGAREVF